LLIPYIIEKAWPIGNKTPFNIQITIKFHKLVTFAITIV